MRQQVAKGLKEETGIKPCNPAREMLQELLECLKALVLVDESWLPDREGYSLYLRPFMFASSFNLGIFPPSRTTLSLLCSPVGPYFADGASLACFALCVQDEFS